MLLAMLAIAAAVLHRAVRQQPAHAIDALDGVDEERVARGLHQRLVETHAALVQLVGAVAVDAAVEQVAFGGAAARQHALVDAVGRFEQGRGFQRQAQPVRLQQADGKYFTK